MCVRHEHRNRSDCFYCRGELKKGDDSDSSGHTQYTPRQWLDLLNPDLLPMDFDAVLLGVLQSATEMEKINGLDEEEFRSVIDVLGQVSTLFGSLLTVSIR